MGKEGFKSFVAVLIALVSILGASAACLSAVAISAATDDELKGLSAAINAQKARIINYINGYEHYRAFTTFVRYRELGFLMYEDAAVASAEEATRLNTQGSELIEMAGEIRYSFLLPRYLADETQYDLERELSEAWAEDRQSNDLDASPYFENADRLRARSRMISLNMIVFAFAFWFFMVAQVTEKRIKYIWLSAGILCTFGGILGTISAYWRY